jgi:hypothetical protein
MGVKLGFLLVFGEGQHEVVDVDDGEFGCSVKRFLEAVDQGSFFADAFEELADVLDLYIEQQGSAFLAFDLGQGIADAFEGLEHKGHLTVSDHSPNEVVLVFAGYGHGEAEAEELVKIQRCADVFYEEVGGE